MKIPCRPWNFDPLWYWINERHWIYLRRRSNKPWPWTKDPILQDYRFCNVFRELDVVTQWIRRRWCANYRDHSTLWFAMAVARQINWPDTLEEIGYPDAWQPERVRKIMKARAKRKETVYTGAYIITAGGQPGPKIDYTIDKVLTPLWRSRLAFDYFNTVRTDTMMRLALKTPFPKLEDAWDVLIQHEGFGPFLSYEVVTDLRWTTYLNTASDIMTWANAGPGAKRGLNRLFGRPTKYRLDSDQALEEMRKLLAMSQQKNRPLGDHVPALEMRDIEHSLCEVDKYLRVKNGEGKPRSRYRKPEVA